LPGDEKFDFEKATYSGKADKKTLAKFRRINVIQVLDLKGNVVMVFKRGEN
jgi:hypothetical protein